jgi:hypothetical protein
MTTSKQFPSRRRSTLGTVIAVFGVLVLTAVIAAVCLGIVVVRSLGIPDGTSPFREELFARLDLPHVSQVEVTVPPWLVVLGRVAASIADVDPRLNDGLAALKCGQVGVYELARVPSRRDVLTILELADQELGEAGWSRVVTVLEDEQLVAVYQSAGGGETEFDAYVIVLDDRDLVMVSAKGRVEPMTKLVAAAMEEAGLRDLRF